MSIELKDMGITYYPVTKSGSTSIKYAIMAIAGSEGLVVDLDHDVHRFFGTQYTDPFHPLYDDCPGRFTIIREPLERLLSAYSNRVGYRQVQLKAEADMLDRLGIPREPDLEEFILNVETYCLVSADLRLHLASPRRFLGCSLFQFDHVFKVERMDEVQAFLSAAAGREVEMPRLQTGGRKHKPSELSPRALAKALRFCRYDYAFLVDYYDPGRWGGIPSGAPDEPSTLSVAGDADVWRNPAVTHPRTLGNLGRFLTKRPLKGRSFDASAALI